MKDKRFRFIMLMAAAVLAAAALLSLCLGAASISLPELLPAIAGGASTPAGRIFWYSRLPRTAACMLSGAALAASGAVIQGALANRLASPGLIGVNAGAGLAVTIALALGAAGGWAIAGAAFFGAMSAALLITAAAKKTGASRTTVILGGVALNSLLSAASEGITTLLPGLASASVDFRVGGFSSVSHIRLIPAGILIAAALAALLTLTSELDLLTLGEQAARGMGLSVNRARNILLLLAALLAGASVSFAGLLGFAGLIIPNAARRLCGGESGRLLPLCMLMGAGFVTICDLAARLIFAPYELPAGVVMSAVGAPAFMLLLIKSRGGRSNG